jgi:peptide-methionine (R)-S-oxide reductase
VTYDETSISLAASDLYVIEAWGTNMQRRHFLQRLCAFVVAGLGFPVGARSEKGNTAAEEQEGPAIAKLNKQLSEWRQLLAPQAYAVLFEEATERPFSSPLNEEKRAGTFICAACYLPLFESTTKFNSGTGWPSFYQPLTGRMDTKTDYKLIWPRTEYHCIRCAHHRPVSAGVTTELRSISFRPASHCQH